MQEFNLFNQLGFNIDKRLPLKLVIPEVMHLQDKKKRSSHSKKKKVLKRFYLFR